MKIEFNTAQYRDENSVKNMMYSPYLLNKYCRFLSRKAGFHGVAIDKTTVLERKLYISAESLFQKGDNGYSELFIVINIYYAYKTQYEIQAPIKIGKGKTISCLMAKAIRALTMNGFDLSKSIKRLSTVLDISESDVILAKTDESDDININKN